MAAILLLHMAGGAIADAPVVHVYSAQKEHLIRPVLDKFTRQTGITVKLLTGDKAALVTRLAHEGEYTPADLLLTADIGNLYQATQKGLLQPIRSDVLNANIPAYLRDESGLWYGLTRRARLLFVRRDTMADTPEKRLDYTDIANESWHGKLLIRSSDSVYNQSLMAFMIHHYGEEVALQWAKGVVANLARAPKGGDRDQLRALAAGEGDVAVANSYYYSMMIAGDASMHDRRVQEAVIPVFPPEGSVGVHMNIRGGGVTRYADNAEGAILLLEFLSDEAAQSFFTETNLEYPVNPRIVPHKALAAMGEMQVDDTPLSYIGALQAKAIMLMDDAGWK
ncbi:MAG: extracellular solute-binding protein [Sphaerospermopsis sp. SIO1G2]|nr:extracellular solute-binding protein [Sphaerospermopsis sp. SIO1G2]